MPALKGLVIGLAVLILAGLVLLAYGLATRFGAGAGPAGDSLGDIAVAVPPGCTLAESTTAGGRLVLRLDGARERGCQRVLLYDLESGGRLGSFTLAP
ncbi:MAG: hypothetical protein ACREDZ_06885 [Kiloniellales bacterium]